MGTWGPAIFSDDIACDIRDRYRDHLGDGLTGEHAMEALLDEYKEILEDPEEAPVFWLALAKIQWQYGRLEQRVQVRALEVIDNGTDLVRWEAYPQLLKKRQAVLNKLREDLLSPQPPLKRIPQRFRDTCLWEIGELISYQLPSGNFIVFRLIGYHTDLGGTSPIFELLDWVGDDFPDAEGLESLGIKTDRGGDTQIGVGRVSQREIPRKRVRRLGMKLNPAQQVTHPHPATLWRWLDRELEARFGLR